MKNTNLLKTIFLVLVISFVGAAFFSIMAQTTFGQMVNQAKNENQNIKTLVGWICAILELVGVVVVGSKLLSGKPDAREGLVAWIGGMIFIGIATLVIELSL